MVAPKTVEEIFERKRAARRRYDGMTLIEKIEAMAALRRDLDTMFGDRRPGSDPPSSTGHHADADQSIRDRR